MVWSGQVGFMGYTTVAICGPTASGKTSLSLNVAEELSGEIVEETMSDESCGTANIRQQIFQVSGARVAEVVLAREEVKP